MLVNPDFGLNQSRGTEKPTFTTNPIYNPTKQFQNSQKKHFKNKNKMLRDNKSVSSVDSDDTGEEVQ